MRLAAEVDEIVVHDAAGHGGVDLGLLDELLGEDAGEEAPGEEGEDEERHEGHGDERDVDPVGERPERVAPTRSGRARR